MRRLTFALVCAVVSFPAQFTWHCASHCLAQTPDLPTRSGLLANQQFVRLAIIAGRLEAVGLEVYGRTINTAQETPTRREHLTVAMHDGGVSLRYDVQADDEEFTFDILSDERVFVRRTIPGVTAKAVKSAIEGAALKRDETGDSKTRTVIEYEQLGRKEISLTVREGEQSQRYQAASLWHLLIAEPKVCHDVLVPLFERLRADWRLELMASETKQALLRAAALPQADQTDKWKSWVAELASERFAIRQQADRQLRQAGHAAIPFLQGIDKRSLDAEQWHRVQEIILSYRDVLRDDSVDQNVLRLIGDRSFWLVLLDDAEASTRELAAAHLSRIVGQPLAFEPSGNEARRRQQIEALRITLGLQK